jgi:hypothetical protein
MPGIERFSTVEKDGVLEGPVRRPDNISKAALGSIHDDATAQKLGFRGGTVAANIHFEQFPPLMEAVFGPAWHHTGGLSLHFMNPTTDGEPVQAFARRLADDPICQSRAEVWMETPEGLRICEGSASLAGPDPRSALQQRLATARPARDLRILGRSKTGDAVRDVHARLTRETIAPRLELITEPMPAYRDPSVYGEIVAAPAVAIDALRVAEGPLFRPASEFVGMFGAIELQFLAGPVFVDHDYLVDARVLALSESPKTEIVWYESKLRDAIDNRPVAQMIMMTRLLKSSSPAWT